jgi:hypothetical protein
MKIKIDRKLTLSRETLSRLENRHLAEVQGAYNSVRSGCATTCVLIVCGT